MTEQKKTRRTQKTVRNNRGVTLHLRLQGRPHEKPFRVALNPRGARGDWVTVPAACTEDPQFEEFVNMGLLEIIPLREARAIEYPKAQRPGGLGDVKVQVVRDSARSKVVGYVDAGTTEMTRQPKMPSVADVKPDAETQKLVDSGVMLPLPTVRKNNR